MLRHFDEELARLKSTLLRMGGLAEAQLHDALLAMTSRNSDLAERVIEQDLRVNTLDVEIDEECIRLLALQQPAARDLRLITTGMKIASELERIGDLAESIATRTIELNEEPQLKPYIDIPRMGNWAAGMVKDSLDSFLRGDVPLAQTVMQNEAFVNDLMEQIFRELLSYMIEDPRTITRALRLLFVAKSIERVADHATNIAELVVYMVEGKIIRHTVAAISLPPPTASN
ncbi:MAG: phosphate signaling complex protein PhoU [Nitrospiraceae bacterium]